MKTHEWKLERSEDTSYVCILCGAREHAFVGTLATGKLTPLSVLEHCEEEAVRLVLEE